MRSLCLVLVFLISSAWSAPTSPLYVVVGPLNLKSLIGNKAHTLYDDYGLIVGGGIKGSSVMVKEGASLEVKENIEGSQIDNSGKKIVGGSIIGSEVLTGEQGTSHVAKDITGSIIENQGKQNVGQSELVNTETGNFGVGGNVDEVIADLHGDTVVKGNIEDSDILVGSQGDTVVGGQLKNTNVEVE